MIYVGCHATAGGYLGIDLDSEAKGSPQVPITDVEELIEATTTGSITIDPTLIGPDTKFRIRGCEIGSNTKFLGLLKGALGGGVSVNAPVFFDSYVPVRSKKTLGGVFEWFNYVFIIRRPTRFADRAAALTEYKAQSATFHFIDGTSVPDTSWEMWLPLATHRIWRYRGLDIVSAERDNVVPLGQKILGIETLPAGSYMTTWERRIVNKLPNLKATETPTPTNPRLDTESEMRTFAKAELPKQPRFTSAHPLPVYEQYGFSTLDLMVDGISWRVEMTDATTGERRLIGTQFEYAVGPPVLDASGNLFFNFERGPDAPATVASVVGVQETNPKFFGTV